MYKVFMNDKPIILTDSPQNDFGFQVYDFENVVIDEILHKLKKDKLFAIKTKKRFSHLLSAVKFRRKICSNGLMITL